jgi:hypothetical protein
MSSRPERFKTHNGSPIGDVPPQTLDLSHLVLRRNGTLTDPGERTLIVELTDIEVPPAGVTVTLKVETQHRDPDLGGDSGPRIPVWRESRWITNTSGFTQTGVTAVFVHEFDETVVSGAGTIATPILRRPGDRHDCVQPAGPDHHAARCPRRFGSGR